MESIRFTANVEEKTLHIIGKTLFGHEYQAVINDFMVIQKPEAMVLAAKCRDMIIRNISNPTYEQIKGGIKLKIPIFEETHAEINMTLNKNKRVSKSSIIRRLCSEIEALKQHKIVAHFKYPQWSTYEEFVKLPDYKYFDVYDNYDKYVVNLGYVHFSNVCRSINKTTDAFYIVKEPGTDPRDENYTIMNPAVQASDCYSWNFLSHRIKKDEMVPAMSHNVQLNKAYKRDLKNGKVEIDDRVKAYFSGMIVGWMILNVSETKYWSYFIELWYGEKSINLVIKKQLRGNMYDPYRMCYNDEWSYDMNRVITAYLGPLSPQRPEVTILTSFKPSYESYFRDMPQDYLTDLISIADICESSDDSDDEGETE